LPLEVGRTRTAMMLRYLAMAGVAAVAADAAPAPAGANATASVSRREHFARRAIEEKVRVIHGSGGGWDAEVDRRMMGPYWAAQDAGAGPLLRINTNSGPGEVDHETEAIMRKLQLEFETVDGLMGEECEEGAYDEELVERVNNAAGVWFGGGLPGRAVSCLFGFAANQFGVNTPPDATTPLLEALRNHPLVGGISAGAMMQPSAPLVHGNEISYTPGFHESADIMRIGELMMNNRGAGFIADSFTIHSHFSERGCASLGTAAAACALSAA
jgi:cyanophycinase-like exopeptidase